MSRLRSLYHRAVPDRVRVPLGRVRRDALDRFRRATSGEPFPPSRLLASIQPTPWLDDYLESGTRATAAIRAALERVGVNRSSPIRVLDFGCGPARILRHLRDTAWELSGCDPDSDAIAWCTRSFPQIRFSRSSRQPPLPFARSSFDVVLAVSVFPHFSPPEHSSWRIELARLLKPGGILLLSTLGPPTLRSFTTVEPSTALAALREEGYFETIDPSGVAPRIAFHSPSGVARLLAPELELLEWRERALDGMQDLATLRMPGTSRETGRL